MRRTTQRESMNTTATKNLRVKIALVLSLVAALVTLPAADANAYWYNITSNGGSQTIQVKNTDNNYFGIAPGRSANNVNRAWAGWRQCIRIKNMQTFAVWTTCFPQGGYVNVPASPGGVIQLQKYNY